jgi:hypothetical protein
VKLPSPRGGGRRVSPGAGARRDFFIQWKNEVVPFV